MPDAMNLKLFARRVRVVRFWRGATLGLLFGSVVACVLVGILRLRGHVAPWPYPVAAACAVSFLWALVSALRRISEFDLADSLDRRAGLKNRLATALGISSAAEGVEADLQLDATRHLEGVRPKRIYPLRFGRLQGLAIAVALAAGVVTILGNRPIVLSALERERRTDADEAATAVERVLQPYVAEKPPAKLGKQEKDEIAEMERLAHDLRDGKVDRAQALQRANKAVEDAKKLEARTADATKANLEKAETAMAALEKSVTPDATPIDPSEAMAASEQEELTAIQKQIAATRQALAGATGQKAADLQSQLKSLQKQLGDAEKAAGDAAAAFKAAAAQHNDDDRHIEGALKLDPNPNAAGGSPDPLAEFKRLRVRLMAATQNEIANIKKRLETATGAEAERLRKKLAELEAQYAEAKKEVDAYNKALRAAIKAAKAKKVAGEKPGPAQPALHLKFNKPMQSALVKLKQALNKIESGDDLSAAESKELEKIGDQMDVQAASAAASGDKERELTAKLLADAARALAQGNAAVMLAGACRNGLGAGDGTQQSHGMSPHEPGQPGYMPTSSENNIGKVNHLDKPAAGRGKTTPTLVDPLKGDGPSSYVEVRGPASLGARSAIPYRTVLPSYQRKEEAALNRGKIPKKHQKRVRAYFDSLTGN